VESHCKEELEVLLARHQVSGYTEIPGAHGIGASGVRMGSGAHPQTSSVFFTVLPAERLAPLREEILAYCQACAKTMKMVVWGVEEMV
jgi:hypothetical protein